MKCYSGSRSRLSTNSLNDLFVQNYSLPRVRPAKGRRHPALGIRPLRRAENGNNPHQCGETPDIGKSRNSRKEYILYIYGDTQIVNHTIMS
jgi:hypothetical protein